MNIKNINIENVIKRKKKTLLISFVFGVSALIGDSIIAQYIYEKLAFIFLIVIGVILFIYYYNNLNQQNNDKKFIETYGNYNRFRNKYFKIFVPYSIVLLIINMIIIYFTNANLYVILFLLLITLLSSFFIYNRYIKRNT